MDTGDASWLEEVAWDADGLVPVIAQDADSRQVLMMAWTDRAGLQETVSTGEAVYWSRSRRRRWKKGEESGFVQRVREVRLDCDGDVVLYQVDQKGGIACHTGRQRCFFRRLADGRWEETDAVIKDPAEIYGKA